MKAKQIKSLFEFLQFVRLHLLLCTQPVQSVAVLIQERRGEGQHNRSWQHIFNQYVRISSFCGKGRKERPCTTGPARAFVCLSLPLLSISSNTCITIRPLNPTLAYYSRVAHWCVRDRIYQGIVAYYVHSSTITSSCLSKLAVKFSHCRINQYEHTRTDPSSATPY